MAVNEELKGCYEPAWNASNGPSSDGISIEEVQELTVRMLKACDSRASTCCSHAFQVLLDVFDERHERDNSSLTRHDMQVCRF